MAALEEKSYENTILDFNIECWLDKLGDATFPTEFLEITADDAKMFMDAFKEHEEKQT